jgi:hypothetical protein
MRWRTAVGLSAGGVLLLMGCGQTAETSDYASFGSTEADKALARLDTVISGTVKERTAGAYLAHRALNDPVKACMAELGFTYADNFVGHSQGLTDPGGSSETWTAPLMSSGVSANARGAVAAVREEQRFAAQTPDPTSVEASNEYSRALEGCAPTSNGYAQETSPPGAMALASDLSELVVTVEKTVGPSTTYNRCMQEAMYDVVVDDVDGYQGLVHLLRSHLPNSSSIPAPGDPTTSEWERFLRYEAAALATDANCRGDEHNKAMQTLAPLLEKFEDDHATQIGQLRQEWRDIVARATSAGWNAPSLPLTG